jgi:hypothetical protein
MGGCESNYAVSNSGECSTDMGFGCDTCQAPVRAEDNPRSQMTGDQFRTLKVGDRVRWGDTITDFGTVVGTAWNGVTIDWDDGHTTSIQHNDMAQTERVPVMLM